MNTPDARGVLLDGHEHFAPPCTAGQPRIWNDCTRPADRNGFGFSIAETDERAALIESNFSFAADSEATHQEWRRIVVAAGVSGIQAHDARIVAAMHVHGIANLLTLNAKDFRRFSEVTVLSPDEVLASFS